MMRSTQARARVTKTLFVRAQTDRRAGKNTGRRGSKDVPRPVASSVMQSMATPDSLVRSDLIALVIGVDSDRSKGTIVSG